LIENHLIENHLIENHYLIWKFNLLEQNLCLIIFLPFFSIFDLIDFDQMVFDQMSFGQMVFDQMSFDRMVFDKMSFDQMVFDVIDDKPKNLIFDVMVFDIIYIRSYGVRSNVPSIKCSFDLLVHSRLVTFDLVVGRLSIICFIAMIIKFIIFIL
jgi:hypothetical protein